MACPFTNPREAFGLGSSGNYAVSSNTAYLLKRGSVLEIGSYAIDASGKSRVMIASYGDADLPRASIIRSDKSAIYQGELEQGSAKAAILFKASSDITLRDLNLEDAEGFRSSYQLRFWEVDTGLIYNTRFAGGGWGMRLMFSDNIRFLNSIIDSSYEDNLFIQGSQGVEVAYSTFISANNNWINSSTPESVAGGDSVQFSGTHHINFHHNYMDRGDKGSKFCLIIRNEDRYVPIENRTDPETAEKVSATEYSANPERYRMDVQVTDNFCVKPRADGKGGAGFYFGEHLKGDVSRNVIIDSPLAAGLSGIYMGYLSTAPEHFFIYDNLTD